MRRKSSVWFETKIRYEKTMEDGKEKKVTEAYVVDVLSFTEAEETIINEVKQYITGDFKVVSIKQASYEEIIFTDNEKDDKYFQAKLQYIAYNEKSGKVQPTTIPYLVQGSTLQGAIKTLETYMRDSQCDWRMASITDTKLLDVFEHQP